MMTPNMLERATQAFRRGYRDARNGRDAAQLVPGTFSGTDYAEGYAAAVTELKLEAARQDPYGISRPGAH